MAACIPTLPPLYRLLRGKMPLSVSKKPSTTSSPLCNDWLRHHQEGDGIIQSPVGENFMLPLQNLDMLDEKRTSEVTGETKFTSLEVDRDLERMESREAQMESRNGFRTQSEERTRHMERVFGHAIWIMTVTWQISVYLYVLHISYLMEEPLRRSRSAWTNKSTTSEH